MNVLTDTTDWLSVKPSSLPISEYVLPRLFSGTPARLASCVHKSQLLSCEGAIDGGRCGVKALGEQKTRMLAARSVEKVTMLLSRSW